MGGPRIKLPEGSPFKNALEHEGYTYVDNPNMRNSRIRKVFSVTSMVRDYGFDLVHPSVAAWGCAPGARKCWYILGFR